jgi:hypothetical protein
MTQRVKLVLAPFMSKFALIKAVQQHVGVSFKKACTLVREEAVVDVDSTSVKHLVCAGLDLRASTSVE